MTGADETVLEHALETQVRPFLRIHGGDIRLLDSCDDGRVELEFEGACRACALKHVTYAIAVRERLRRIPGVSDVSVRGVNLSSSALARVARAYAGSPTLPGAARPSSGGPA